MPLAVVYALATQLAYLSRLEAPTTVMGGGASPAPADRVHKRGPKCGRRPQNRPDLRINPEKTSTCPQKRPVLRIKSGETGFHPH